MRAGYAELLAWVVRSARIDPHHDVLELGAGTGNLTRLLPPAHRVVAVDVSTAMLEIAATKVRGSVEWQRGDLLEYFDDRSDRFDRFVSTYAIHHLVRDEKELLFRRIRDAANPGARAAFGDLMFESERDRAHAIERYREEWPDVAAAIEDEFFWIVDDCVEALRTIGLRGRHASRQRSVVGRTGDARLTKKRGPKPPYANRWSVGAYFQAPNLYSTSRPYVRGFVSVPVRRKLSASDNASI